MSPQGKHTEAWELPCRNLSSHTGWTHSEGLLGPSGTPPPPHSQSLTRFCAPSPSTFLPRVLYFHGPCPGLAFPFNLFDPNYILDCP